MYKFYIKKILNRNNKCRKIDIFFVFIKKYIVFISEKNYINVIFFHNLIIYFTVIITILLFSHDNIITEKITKNNLLEQF